MDKKDLKDEKLLYNVRETAAVLGIDFVERYEGMDLSDLDNIKELQQNMN